MTKEMFDAMIARAECRDANGGRSEVPDGRSMTLYLSRDGASLQVSRVTELSLNDGIIEAIDKKGELFMLALADLFAASVSGASKENPARKAGFLS